ncbi:MAG: hypothetical protein AB2705_12555 [Candidatus Thiodiazotropha sp.]
MQQTNTLIWAGLQRSALAHHPEADRIEPTTGYGAIQAGIEMANGDRQRAQQD